MATPSFHIPKDLSLVRKVECAGCGKGPREVNLIKLPAYVRSWACAPCILRYGVQMLTGEIDRHVDLAVGSKQTSAPCQRGCGRFVLPDRGGRFPIWCDECERERRAIGKGVLVA